MEKQKKIIITAHRGASGLAPENTLASFEKAIDIGADYAELDVTFTKDQQLIVIHDDTLQRTTNGYGKVNDFTLAELKKLDAGSWFDGAFAGERLPTLAEVIDLARDKIKLNIEIKVGNFNCDLTTKVIDTLRDENFSSECMITSFNFEILEQVVQIAPEIPCGPILGLEYPSNVFNQNWALLSVNYRMIGEHFLEQARKNPKQVHVWTVNKLDLMTQLVEIGVDGIITNFPDRLIEFRK